MDNSISYKIKKSEIFLFFELIFIFSFIPPKKRFHQIISKKSFIYMYMHI